MNPRLQQEVTGLNRAGRAPQEALTEPAMAKDKCLTGEPDLLQIHSGGAFIPRLMATYS